MTKKYAPATMRNRQPILNILREILPQTGNILEIASGTGEHSIFFAPSFAEQKWFPSDINQDCLQSIQAWREECMTSNLQPPCAINVMEKQWSQNWLVQNINTIVCINMIHIAPWEAYLGLMEGAADILKTKGIVYLYGPYKSDNVPDAPSNVEFDLYLRAQNPNWGVRNLEQVISVAQTKGFELQRKIAMPANNFSLVFQKVAR